MSRVLGVIPARLHSQRLPRKVLREIAGRPLLAWVYEAARAAPQLDQLLIAVDSPEVADLCQRNGWPFRMTSPSLPSGTDRLHAISQMIDADIYVNIQGDEPLLQPTHIAALLAPFRNPAVDASTLKIPCTPEEITNPNAVKVVTAQNGRALYFSRSPIPYVRHNTARDDTAADNTARSNTARDNTAADNAARDNTATLYWKHLGLYAYRRAALQRFAALPPGHLEQIEKLEQLRLLENNLALHVAEVTEPTVGVDTEEDLHRAEAILLRNHPRPRQTP